MDTTTSITTQPTSRTMSGQAGGRPARQRVRPVARAHDVAVQVGVWGPQDATRLRSSARPIWTASGCCAPATPPLSPDDLAAAYKQLLQVERGWRDMKGALGLRPVFHYREDRIRAHVQLCWLALLLLRMVENATDDTWRNVRHELDRMHLVTLATADGQVAQRSAVTAKQKTILAALKLPEPPRFFDFTVPSD
jgi:hypothetical protein